MHALRSSCVQLNNFPGTSRHLQHVYVLILLLTSTGTAPIVYLELKCGSLIIKRVGRRNKIYEFQRSLGYIVHHDDCELARGKTLSPLRLARQVIR